MKIHINLNRYLQVFSVILILIAFFSDLVRHRIFMLGPLQYVIIGVAFGALSTSLMTRLTSYSIQYRIFVTLILYTSAGLSSLAIFNHSILPEFFLISGLLFGAGTAVIVSIQQWEKGETPTRLYYSLFFFIIIIPFLYQVLLNYINLDLWFDEIFTLDWFVFGTLQNTLTNYISTNNHIFLNILNHLYLQVIGVQDIYDLMGKVYQLRLLILLYSLVTLFYVFRTGLKFFHHPSTAGFAVVALATTVPFYNFSVQIRGYGLSSMLVSMLVYYCWTYEEKPERRLLPVILILSTLILYTIPTNLYVLASFGFFYVFYTAVKLISIKRRDPDLRWLDIIEYTDRNNPNTLYNKNILPILSIFVGCIIAVLLYLPVVQQFMSQAPSAAATGEYTFIPLTATFPTIMKYLISGRKMFLLLLLLAFVLLLTGRIIKIERFDCRKLLTFSILIVIPFLINQVYGQIPYTRVFVMISPLFALWVTSAYECCLMAMQKSRLLPWILFSILGIYCYSTFTNALELRDNKLLSDIKTGKVSQNIYYNYYQAYYHPYNIIKEFTETIQTQNTPVYVYHWGDTQSTPYYLKKGFVYYHVIDYPEDLSFDITGDAFIFTALPLKSIEEITRAQPGSQCRIASQELDFLNVLYCESRF